MENKHHNLSNNYHNLLMALDLSFSSTGVFCSIFNHQGIVDNVSFHKIVEGSKPRREPINLDIRCYQTPQLIGGCVFIPDNNQISIEQIQTTTRAMSCARTILSVLEDYISINPNINDLYLIIENYIMPSFGGKNQLKTVGGLIMLNGFVRERIIKYCMDRDIIVHILTPTPSTIKKFFTGNGSAIKDDMVRASIELFDINKLLPDLTTNHLDIAFFNDVIDAFAMGVYIFKSYISQIQLNQ